MHRQIRHQRGEIHGKPSSGFTLLELLIAVSILLILLAITATAIRVNNNADRVRGGARTLQSYLLGAKDRAIYAKAPRGVRFLRDGTNLRTVTSMVYIEPTPSAPYSVTVVPFNTSLTWNSSTNPMRRVRLSSNFNAADQVDWQTLVDSGLLQYGLRVRMPSDNRGTWYVIQSIDTTSNPGKPELVLTTEIRNPNSTGQVSDTALIELPPSVVQNSEPVQLPRGVVIDLDRCSSNASVVAGGRLPASWRIGPPVGSASFSYTSQLDLMFSPRGGVTGLAASSGIIHFYLTDQAAADLTLDASYGVNATGTLNPPIPDKFAVSVFTRTGNIVVSPVNTVDNFINATGASGSDNIADDPFYYSERGEVAGK